jgi:hypothetical protein
MKTHLEAFMRRLSLLCFFAATLLPLELPAATPMSEYMSENPNAVLSAQAINAACVADPGNTNSPTCASFTVTTKGFKRVALIVRYTKSSATEVQVYKDSSVANAAPWGVRQLGDAVAPPKIVMGDEYRAWNVSAMSAAASATWEAVFDVTAPYTRFRITSTGGAVGDVVTVYVVLIGG